MQGPASAFPSANRLKKAAEFRNVFNSPYRSVDKHFIILAKPNKLPVARLGLAISKKRIGRAVDRNRVKRLIRESFRYRKVDLQGIDVVVMAQKQIAFNENRLMSDSLNKHWNKVALCAR